MLHEDFQDFWLLLGVLQILEEDAHQFAKQQVQAALPAPQHDRPHRHAFQLALAEQTDQVLEEVHLSKLVGDLGVDHFVYEHEQGDDASGRDIGLG